MGFVTSVHVLYVDRDFTETVPVTQIFRCLQNNIGKNN